ncbi:MAG: polysaccharide deacetylase family protein [Eubacteriales bacterium]
MDTNHSRESEYRRRRVQRFKMLILTVVCVLLISPTVCSIFLTARVLQLDEQVQEYKSQLDEYVATNFSQDDQITGLITSTSDIETEGLGEMVAVPEELTTVSGKCVYLTFDDGPSSQTSKILDILLEYDVKATFFVLGNKSEQLDPLYQRIVDEGHTIALHSYTHDYAEIYASTETLQSDILKLQEKIFGLTGVNTSLYRFPGGSSNDYIAYDLSAYIDLVESMGLTYYDWNVSSGDTGLTYNLTAEYMVESMITSVKGNNQSIVLMHDSSNHITTIEALPLFIEQLQEMDVQILPITQDTNAIQHIINETNE